MSELNRIALKIISSGKGILAADESNGTMTKRLESVNVKSSEENRLKFRSILFTSKMLFSSSFLDFISFRTFFTPLIVNPWSLSKNLTVLIIKKSFSE